MFTLWACYGVCIEIPLSAFTAVASFQHVLNGEHCTVQVTSLTLCPKSQFHGRRVPKLLQPCLQSEASTMCADPIGSGNMLTPSKTSKNIGQLMNNRHVLPSLQI